MAVCATVIACVAMALGTIVFNSRENLRGACARAAETAAVAKWNELSATTPEGSE